MYASIKMRDTGKKRA